MNNINSSNKAILILIACMFSIILPHYAHSSDIYLVVDDKKNAKDERWESKKRDLTKEFTDQYDAAYENSDLVKYMSLYSIAAIEDSKYNYDQIAQNYDSHFKKGPYTHDLSEIKTAQADSAYIITARYTVTPKNQPKLKQEGYVRWLLVMEDQRLKVMRSDHAPTFQELPTSTSVDGMMSARNKIVQTTLRKDYSYEQIREQYEKEKFSTMLKVLKESPTPIRTDDTIIRVYILPYTDDNDRLHGSTITYFKVEDGKWLLGDYLVTPKTSANQVTTPLENAPDSPEGTSKPQSKPKPSKEQPNTSQYLKEQTIDEDNQ